MDTIVSLLDISLSDFSLDVPFMAYGLDSLGATRIAEAIQPYMNVSQM
jgi:Phosphopantetheine attachment site